MQPSSNKDAKSEARAVTDPAVLELLACPACGGDLRVDGERLVCLGCGRSYPIVDGIPVLIRERGEKALEGTDLS